MLTHDKIWEAIDKLASQNKLSVSGLARKAGLDPTSFNKSKRETPSGRPRWPSTESIAKALAATDTTLDIFMATISSSQLLSYSSSSMDRDSHAASSQLSDAAPLGFADGEGQFTFSGNYRQGRLGAIPIIGFAQAGVGGFFDNSGFPTGEGWDETRLPIDGSDGVYGLRVSGDSMMPLYRHSDIIVVSPTAPIAKGDRVVVGTVDGEIMAKEVAKLTGDDVSLASLNPEHEGRHFKLGELKWMARIVWASQ